MKVMCLPATYIVKTEPCYGQMASQINGVAPSASEAYLIHALPATNIIEERMSKDEEILEKGRIKVEINGLRRFVRTKRQH